MYKPRKVGRPTGTKKPRFIGKDGTEYTKEELKHMIKTINDSLYRLEKRGVSAESAMYRTAKHYAESAPNASGKMYNLDPNTGHVRVSKDLSRYKNAQDAKRFVEILENLLKAKTRTVKGTREAMKKGLETLKRKHPQIAQSMTLEQYTNIWHTYRDMVSKDKRSMLESDKVIMLIETTNIYDLTQDELEKAMEYINNAETFNDALDLIEMDTDLPFEVYS